MIQSEGSDQIHVIYWVERDGVLIPYEDAFSTLSYVSDEEFSEMIGLTVIEKVKRKLYRNSNVNYIFVFND